MSCVEFPHFHELPIQPEEISGILWEHNHARRYGFHSNEGKQPLVRFDFQSHEKDRLVGHHHTPTFALTLVLGRHALCILWVNRHGIALRLDHQFTPNAD